MTTLEIIALAAQHLNNKPENQESATICLRDALAAQVSKSESYSRQRALRSLQYSLGPYHEDYKRAAAELPRPMTAHEQIMFGSELKDMADKYAEEVTELVHERFVAHAEGWAEDKGWDLKDVKKICYTYAQHCLNLVKNSFREQERREEQESV